uniref:Nudix hydrolase domain-containing protein n=1 Tax=Rhabditophanes sp. KR3021 TaxID=114890 RepID=A0AC35UHV1_9BILA
MADGNMNNEECPYVLWDEKVVFDGRWMRAKQVNFKKGTDGKPGVWQMSSRATKPKDVEVAGICVIAILKKNGKKFIVLVKQYRIPVKSYCIEFAAGLVDNGDSVTSAGLRELKEETGYTASKVISQPRNIQCLNPGLTDDSVQFMVVEIDGDPPENLNPVQCLEEDETVSVILVETGELLTYLDSLGKSVQVEAMVYSFALALNFQSFF